MPFQGRSPTVGQLPGFGTLSARESWRQPYCRGLTAVPPHCTCRSLTALLTTASPFPTSATGERRLGNSAPRAAAVGLLGRADGLPYIPWREHCAHAMHTSYTCPACSPAAPGAPTPASYPYRLQVQPAAEAAGLRLGARAPHFGGGWRTCCGVSSLASCAGCVAGAPSRACRLLALLPPVMCSHAVPAAGHHCLKWGSHPCCCRPGSLWSEAGS